MSESREIGLDVEHPLSGEATAQALVQWLVDAVDRLGKGELDEAVYFLHYRGGSYRFAVQVYRPDQAPQAQDGQT